MNYIIVLGKYLFDDGSMQLDLLERCDKAVEQYNNKSEKTKLLLSGGLANRKANISEASAMEKYMLKRGIPKEDIILEERSKNTLENALFSKKIVGDDYDSIMVISSPYHLYRHYYNPVKLFRGHYKKVTFVPCFNSGIVVPNGFVEGRKNSFIMLYNKLNTAQYLKYHKDCNLFTKEINSKMRDGKKPKKFGMNDIDKLKAHLKRVYMLEELDFQILY